jgi:ion channel
MGTPEPIRQRRPGFWTMDRGLSIFVAALVALIVLPALVQVGLAGRFVGDALISLVLVSGTAAVADRLRTTLIVSVIAVAALLVRWTSYLFPEAGLAVWREISTLATLVALSWVTLVLVLRPGPVTARRIEGAIAVYLLMGFTWAQAYELVSLWHPGAIAGGAEGRDAHQWWTYFSFVTLTTLGYGDIRPVHPLARALAVLEALTGQLYLAILLARLVSLHIGSKRDD